MEIFLNHLNVATYTHFTVIIFALAILIMVAALIDLADGLRTAKALKQKIHSHKARVTIAKLSEYWLVLLLGALIDCVGGLLPFYPLPYVAMTVTLGILGIEVKSVLEHARRRKSGVAKLPESLRDIAEMVGGIDNLKEILLEFTRRNVMKPTEDDAPKPII